MKKMLHAICVLVLSGAILSGCRDMPQTPTTFPAPTVPEPSVTMPDNRLPTVLPDVSRPTVPSDTTVPGTEPSVSRSGKFR